MTTNHNLRTWNSKSFIQFAIIKKANRFTAEGSIAWWTEELERESTKESASHSIRDQLTGSKGSGSISDLSSWPLSKRVSPAAQFRGWTESQRSDQVHQSPCYQFPNQARPGIVSDGDPSQNYRELELKLSCHYSRIRSTKEIGALRKPSGLIRCRLSSLSWVQSGQSG